MHSVTNFIGRAIDRLISEPAVTLAVVVAAINTATDQTWQGYATAIAIALGRFVVSPAYSRDSYVKWG
jgi:hypothetical protein